ncbi:MAG: zinc-ribbon domain-containing protein, partial [Polyangiaceae bacterium]|nr:zinc-ribbon domain-containing protein [Polyangiaceae bacterium]
MAPSTASRTTSCGAKYSISDDKVRGRVVKIRCKKCSTAIVVNGPRETGPDPAEQGGDCDPTQAVGHQEEADVAGGGTQPPGACEEWMLSLANGDQRSVPVDEIRRMMQEGTITDDTRAWRDGMTEWLPIAQIQELADAVIPPRPSQAPRSEPPGPEAARRDARLGAGLFGGGAGAAAARVGSLRHRTQDLFGVQQFPPPDTEEATSAPPHPDSSASRHPKPAFTAERGENSVLFTIDTLRAVGGAQKSSAPLAREGDKIDLAQLTSVVPGRLASEPSDRSDFDAILSMGVAGGFGHASLAAPTLPTSAPPPDPEAKPVLASFLTPAKSKNGLLFGIAAAVSVLVVVSIGFLGYALFGGGEEPIASNVDSIATTSLDKASEDNSVKPGEDKADQDKADKDKADQDKADQDKADQDKADQDKADQDKA